MYRYLYDEDYEDSFERLHFTWRDAVKKGRAYAPPYDEEDMLQKMTEWGEDSIYWRTEYECQFVESTSNIFNPEILKKCFIDQQFAEYGTPYPNCVVGVDIGKSVNSTVISVWANEKNDEGNIANLIYLEEIGPKTGGHDIPYQRKRIMDVATNFGAKRVIIDATGIGGAIEQDIRVDCIQAEIHFIPFVFTGGPKGTKTQVYRDLVSYVQQGQVKVPNPKYLPPNDAKLVNKWYKEHVNLEYTMDAANKTEKIAAPDGKHDDYCDSSVIGIHACLGMLPPESSFASVNINRSTHIPAKKTASGPVFGKTTRNFKVNKHSPGGI